MPLSISATKQFILTRTLQYLATILSSVSITYVIVKAMPVNALEAMLEEITRLGQVMDPESLKILRQTFYEMFGMSESPLEAYWKFLVRVFSFNFGPSLISYGTRADELIFARLPWTIGLLLVTILISWIVGNLLGIIAGYSPEKRLSKMLESVAITVYPIPYYILALLLVFIFAYCLRIFPMGGGMSIVSEQITLDVIINIIWHSTLPALSMVIPGALGWGFLSSKVLSTNIRVEDYVRFAELRGVPHSIILKRYVLRNILPPQITNLAMSLGGIFNGALLTEIIFAYPGVGSLLYRAILCGDLNTLMGIAIFSIIGVTTAAFLLDLIYPLLDPRVRYR